ncbi:MAG: SAM hydrolase/SAM-dependent halogenase family protein [Acidimicrobiia bacterium]
MSAPAMTFSFLSDYGLADEFVGVCKGVVLSFAPEVRVLDITHEIPAHDVRAGALTLVRSVQYLPPGVVMAVVDPGVGTDRRLVAARTADHVLVGPDNGLLAPAVGMVGGATTVVSLTNTDFHLPTPGVTFAGRDVLAPAAGHLAAGVPLEDLGEIVDPASLVPGLVSLPQHDDDAITGEVWWIDRFGNCQLNIDPDELRSRGGRLGSPVEIEIGGTPRMARWVTTYGDARPSELVLVVDSYGLLSLAFDRRSAADELGLRAGSGVALRGASS